MTKKMTYGEGKAVNVHEKAADVHTEAGRANVRDLFTPAFWRSFAALSLVLSVSSFMNVSVFPFFDGVFTYARDISVTANAAVLIAIGLLATYLSKACTQEGVVIVVSVINLIL